MLLKQYNILVWILQSQLTASMRAAQTAAESEGAAAGALRTGLVRVASRVSALNALHADCAPAVSTHSLQYSVLTVTT